MVIRRLLPPLAFVGTLVVLPVDSRAQQSLHVLDGAATRYYFGNSVAGVGDLDGDGCGDLLVGSRRDGTVGDDSGAAFVYSGKTAALLFTFLAESSGDQFGHSVCAAGDVNDDGYDDFVVGAPYNDVAAPNAGAAYVYSGLDGSVLHIVRGGPAQSECGWAVAGGGDINLDGYDDFVVGAPLQDGSASNAGHAVAFSGLDGSTLHSFGGLAADDLLGRSVAIAGDVDGDGYADIAVGIPGSDTAATDAGCIAVFRGSDGTQAWTVAGTRPGMGLGLAIAGVPDVNQDGYDDVLVGAPLDDTSGVPTGSARIYSGLDGSLLHIKHGDSANDQFGMAVNSVGDVNADGFVDWVVGAHLDDNDATNGGSVRLFSGSSGAQLYTLDGDEGNASLGLSVSAGGDVDGDGFDDVLAGQPLSDPNGLNSGSAQVYAGTELFLEVVPREVQMGETITFRTATAPPGTFALLFVTAVDSAPVFIRIPVVGVYDALGQWSFPGTVGFPSTFEIQFQVIATGSLGVQQSNTETVLFN